MRRLLLLLLAATVTLATAMPAFGHNPSEKAIAACTAAVENQIAMGIEAGGGPKQGILAPANCDHFFFVIGAIGNENSGGGDAP